MFVRADYFNDKTFDAYCETFGLMYRSRIDACERNIKEQKTAFRDQVLELYHKYPFLAKSVREYTKEEKVQLYNLLCMNGRIKIEEGHGVLDVYSYYEHLSPEGLEAELQYLFPKDGSQLWEQRLVEVMHEYEDVFYFALNKKLINTRAFDEMSWEAERLLGEGKEVYVVIDENMHLKPNSAEADYIYTQKEMQKLINLNNRLVELGMTVPIKINELRSVNSVESFEDAWTLQDVLKANEEVDKIVETIKRRGYSPFEAMLFLHKYEAQNFTYKMGIGEESCRVIPGLFKNEEVVCSGFTSFEKAVIDKLNYEGLKCEIVGCELYTRGVVKKFKAAHCHAVITIKDEQYNIDGKYADDITFNSGKKKGVSRGNAHCLFPIEDLECYKRYSYYQENLSGRFDALVRDDQKYEGGQLEWLLRRYKRAELVKKYKGKYQPIPLDTYKSGYQNMFFKSYLEVDPEEAMVVARESAEREIRRAIAEAHACFNNSAKSAFMKMTEDEYLEMQEEDKKH